jgi:D-aminopeptidase
MRPATVLVLGLVLASGTAAMGQERPRARDLGLTPGRLEPGPLNAITDVAGVRVGHFTLIGGDHIRTGVTAVVPHPGNLFQEQVPAAMVVGNGFGKLIGFTQVEELGRIETPILLTNTLAVWDAAAALVDHMLGLTGNEKVRSINPVVGETNDGRLNDIRGRHLRKEHFLQALRLARSGPVEEGSVGAGTGTVAFGFKGGIGTSSRRVRDFMLGVLVQSNFGGHLTLDGVPVWRELARTSEASPDGSCMIVVATDAPLDARQLRRLARRALAGMARTGASFSHGSGDYVIAFSTAEGLRARSGDGRDVRQQPVLEEGRLSLLFEAVADATEEAILNSLLRATTVVGRGGREVRALPVGKVIRILSEHGRKVPAGTGS